jgi:hypothetical protein
MTARSAEERLRELVRELEPVRPIPPLRALAVLALALWALALLGDRWAGAPHLRPASDAAWSQAAFLAQLAGLGAAAVGFSFAALASAIPGREGALRLGLGAGALGICAALLGGLCGILDPAPLADGGLGASAGCMLRALRLGLASGLLGCVFMSRARFVRRPLGPVLLALAGGSALGALAVHVTCPSNAALHQLVGHVLAPLVLSAALAFPVAAILRWWRQRTP